MEEINQNTGEEKTYLAYTITLLQRLIEIETNKLSDRKKEMISSRRDMWENSVHFSDDFDRLTEMNQHLQQVQSHTSNYDCTKKNIEKFGNMLSSPYFGRIDFCEEGYEENEKIYIGRANVTDPGSKAIAVYDWRAPISSLYYRYEPGMVSFKAPLGEVAGELTLKRQYKIVMSQLKYFFDCSIQINDEILQEVLGRNSSPKMRSIIETIQKEQDIIIRDTESDLLIVQGVAGSGKTSIALHRIAFLLYEGMTSKLSSNNILILSPNDAFNNYIGHVLPELGEENVESTTMESIVKGCLEDEMKRGKSFLLEGRNEQLEACISGRESNSSSTISSWVEFKGSNSLRTIIDRYLRLYELRLHHFEDVCYNGILIMTRNELKAEFLNNKTEMPMVKRLERIQNRIMDSIADLRKGRLTRLEALVQKSDGHEFEIKSFARLLLFKDSKVFANKLKRFTELDIYSMYQDLFKDKKRFYRLSKGLKLPCDIDEIIENTYKSVRNKKAYYEDWNAIAYISLKAFGKYETSASEIHQVVIDEVQDYYPMQLAIMKELYGEAKFTVVGDIAQSVERSGELSIYEEMPKILKKSKTVRLSLIRSYRASFEINEFAKSIIGTDIESISFPRYEEEPEVLSSENEEGLLEMMYDRVNRYFKEGYETVAILCKTLRQAELLKNKVKDNTEYKSVDENAKEKNKGCSIMTVYESKGLEFDAVLVYDANDLNYCNDIDRRLMYIACTRALHRLSLYYSGEKSRFLKGRM